MRATKEDQIIAYLEKNGFEYLDKRDKLGCLWVFGGQEIANQMKGLKRYGITMHYKAGGGNVTDGKNAWWTKQYCYKTIENGNKSTGESVCVTEDKVENKRDRRTVQQGRTEFANWLKEEGVNGVYIDILLSNLSKASIMANELGFTYSSLYTLDDNEVSGILAKLEKSEEFEKLVINNKNAILAIRKFEEFCSDNRSKLTCDTTGKRMSSDETNIGSSIGLERSRFENYLISNDYPLSRVKAMISALRTISGFAKEQGYTDKPLFLIDDVEQLKTIWELICKDSVYRTFEFSTRKTISVATRHYIYYRGVNKTERASNTLTKKSEVLGHASLKQEPISSTPENSAFNSNLSGQDENEIITTSNTGLGIITQENEALGSLINGYEIDFSNWLFRHESLALGTCNVYVSAVKSAERYAHTHGYTYYRLFDGTPTQISDTASQLLSDDGFLKQKSPYKTGLKKYLEFIASVSDSHSVKTITKSMRDDDLKKRMPTLYSKLYAASKVYDDPKGLSVEQICQRLGLFNEEKVDNLLDQVSWATKVGEGIYSFASGVKRTADNHNRTKDDMDTESFKRVLMTRFRNGMRFDSIDFENFRDVYENLFGETLSFNDAELEEKLRHCGIVYDGRLFPAEGIIDANTKEKLFTHIDRSFSSGKKVLYYKAIFEELADAFASCYTLSDEKMLRAYIEYTAEKGKYYFSPDYISVEKNASTDITSEIEEYLLRVGKPVMNDEVCDALSHIPRDQIIRIITTNRRFLRNARGEYFHVDIFEVSEIELEQIAEIINEFIRQNEYAIWIDIWNKIQGEMPAFLENNPYLSGLGVRNALALKFDGRFNFESAVISMPNDRYVMKDIYQLYAKHHPEFTADDIEHLSKELGTIIYFDALADVSVRVSHDLFVSKDRIRFDVEAVDKAIGSFVSKEYIRIREVDSYLVFPNVGYEWNEYLLESFVHSYSKKYELLNNGLLLNNVAGAIVKKTGSIHEFVDACAAILADAPIPLNKKDALNYLVEVNMITRKSYRNLDSAIRKAKQIRSMKG